MFGSAVKKMKINGEIVEVIRWTVRNCAEFHKFVEVQHNCGRGRETCKEDHTFFVLDHGKEINNKEWLVKRLDGTLVIYKRNPRFIPLFQLFNMKLSFFGARDV